MTRVYFSLGSNVDAEANLRLGVDELSRRLGPLAVSPVYRNKAVGFEGDDFLNLVVGADTDLEIDALVEHIEAIHVLAGRRRGRNRFAPRTLDIDLLTYGDVVSDGPPVRLPRKDVLEYSFVLKPLADIAAAERHPVTGLAYAEHWRALASDAHPLTQVEIDLGR